MTRPFHAIEGTIISMGFPSQSVVPLSSLKSRADPVQQTIMYGSPQDVLSFSHANGPTRLIEQAHIAVKTTCPCAINHEMPAFATDPSSHAVIIRRLDKFLQMGAQIVNVAILNQQLGTFLFVVTLPQSYEFCFEHSVPCELQMLVTEFPIQRIVFCKE